MVSVFVLFVPSAQAASDCNGRCCEEEYPRLTVNGEGKMEVLADKTYFNIKVRAEEKQLQKAFEISSKRINSIQETLSGWGVRKEDIRNLGYIYHPLYEGKKIFTTIDRPSSYEVVYSLQVTVYNLDDLGKILVGLSEVPETTVFGLAYTSTKIEELKREVLKLAAADAKQKAMKLAEGSGAILGRVLQITSSAREYEFKKREMMVSEKSAYDLGAAQAPTAPEVESGYIEIRGECTINFAIQ